MESESTAERLEPFWRQINGVAEHANVVDVARDVEDESISIRVLGLPEMDTTFVLSDLYPILIRDPLNRLVWDCHPIRPRDRINRCIDALRRPYRSIND